jgi:hypothetical protein
MNTRNAWSEKVLYALESVGQLSQQVYHHLKAVNDAIAPEADPLFAGKIAQRYH